jgi:AraC family transcriptional regulator, ethanolamine operon transcriptional activator
MAAVTVEFMAKEERFIRICGRQVLQKGRFCAMQKAKMPPELPSHLWVSGKIRVEDGVSYASAISRLWDVNINQTGAAVSPFDCRFLTDGHCMVFRELYTASAVVRGILRGRTIGFGLSNEIGRSGRWKGRPLPEHALAYTHGERQVDVSWACHTSNLMVVLPLDFFSHRLGILTGRLTEEVFPPAGMYVTLPPQELERLRSFLERLLAGLRPAQDVGLQTLLADAIISACLERGIAGAEGSPAAWYHFRRVLARLEQDQLPGRLTDLAADLGLTLRSVELAFQQCANMSPAAYLHRERLNRVRENLLVHEPGQITVTEIASRQGFTELGRFAGEYRRVFGELPSATLRRRPRRGRGIMPALLP